MARRLGCSQVQGPLFRSRTTRLPRNNFYLWQLQPDDQHFAMHKFRASYSAFFSYFVIVATIALLVLLVVP